MQFIGGYAARWYEGGRVQHLRRTAGSRASRSACRIPLAHRSVAFEGACAKTAAALFQGGVIAASAKHWRARWAPSIAARVDFPVNTTATPVAERLRYSSTGCPAHPGMSRRATRAMCKGRSTLHTTIPAHRETHLLFAHNPSPMTSRQHTIACRRRGTPGPRAPRRGRREPQHWRLERSHESHARLETVSGKHGHRDHAAGARHCAALVRKFGKLVAGGRRK